MQEYKNITKRNKAEKDRTEKAQKVERLSEEYGDLMVIFSEVLGQLRVANTLLAVIAMTLVGLFLRVVFY